MRIITTKVHLNGVYKWGQGFVSNDAMIKWHEFWEKENGGIFWHTFRANQGIHLVTIGGAIYLHPMDFQVLYQKFGRSYTYDDNGKEVETFPELVELEEIIRRCCDHLGCSYEMEPIHEINQ